MRVAVVLLALFGLALSGGARALPEPTMPSGAGGPPVVVEYSAPVPGAVVRSFQPPPTPYAAGHRGVDLAAAQGTVARAAAAGVVRFAGQVAGRGVVVIAHADGITTEYEPVHALVAAGATVDGGEAIARLLGRHTGCPRSCLHWGARRGEQYLDPLALLHPLGPVVLLPWPRDG